MDTDVDIEDITAAVSQLVETLEDLLKYGRQAVQESVNDFVNDKIGKMFGMSVAYEKCFSRMKVSTKKDMERAMRQHSKNVKLREASTELLDVEQEWDTFMKDIDKNLEGDSNESLNIGETGPVDNTLIDARTGTETSLKSVAPHDKNIVLILLRHFA
ncbi:hypothetical protein ACF0H5_003129 [Mactra antiquata]